MGITGEDLLDWPEEKISRYLTVMEIVSKWREAESRARAASAATAARR
jgi:hypothetical protein